MGGKRRHDGGSAAHMKCHGVFTALTPKANTNVGTTEGEDQVAHASRRHSTVLSELSERRGLRREGRRQGWGLGLGRRVQLEVQLQVQADYCICKYYLVSTLYRVRGRASRPPGARPGPGAASYCTFR